MGELPHRAHGLRRRGDKLVVVVDLWGRGRGSGVEVEARAAHLWQFRDGKAVRFEIYGDPAKALQQIA